ncbi:GNAT family N-acetyltransferase [Bosea sp. 117]|uniref:GNAT family N-acetyltransferase n=1 Tax=Bosea sp. 117 TaxID=1125973 RepID=UPI0009DE9799|nr:GNAT family N-acetyltransferase [Bosea sp. 117]
MAELTFVPLDDSRQPELVDLWVASWQAAMPEIDFEARRGWLAARLDSLAAEGSVARLAVEPGGALAGFVMVSPATGYLDQLAVAPRLWGSGVAQALVVEARRLSPGRLELHVNQDNPRAVTFYEREGFRRSGMGVNPRSGLPIWRYVWEAEVTPNAAPAQREGA